MPCLMGQLLHGSVNQLLPSELTSLEPLPLQPLQCNLPPLDALHLRLPRHLLQTLLFDAFIADILQICVGLEHAHVVRRGDLLPLLEHLQLRLQLSLRLVPRFYAIAQFLLYNLCLAPPHIVKLRKSGDLNRIHGLLGFLQLPLLYGLQARHLLQNVLVEDHVLHLVVLLHLSLEISLLESGSDHVRIQLLALELLHLVRLRVDQIVGFADRLQSRITPNLRFLSIDFLSLCLGVALPVLHEGLLLQPQRLEGVGPVLKSFFRLRFKFLLSLDSAVIFLQGSDRLFNSGQLGPCHDDLHLGRNLMDSQTLVL
mmetsp:Transcript_29246/g.64914  ORF Transcript_29246/g.64914 Transcript_29246/m.64914 type:complete len:312 (+) Transcript_29246:1286-2221(+)